VRSLPALTAVALSALILAACGSGDISVPEDDPTHEGAVLFAERCSSCHTLDAAGTQGSGNRVLRQQGPDFNQREATVEDTIFAIENGGFSGAIMPQNIVVGDDARKVAEFLAEWAGQDVVESPEVSPSEEEVPIDEGEPMGSPDQ
jgi:mono/diheme cytochrome c family protein